MTSRALGIGLLGLVVLACTAGPTQFPIPPDAVLVRVFTEGQGALPNPEAYQWHFRAARSAAQDGVVTTAPEVNCVIIGPDWTLTVSAQEGDATVVRAVTRADQFARGATVDVLISRVDGRISFTEGVPAWWDKTMNVPCAMAQ